VQNIVTAVDFTANTITLTNNFNITRTNYKAGKVRKGDGKDINHKDGNALNNSPSNWQVQSRKANRSYPRTKNAGKKNPRD